jgi:hypothetical protein
MTSSKSTWASRRVVAVLVLICLACASGNSSGDGPASPDDVDCDSLTACDGEKCSDGAQCFKIKGCPGFVCTDVQAACKLECGSRKCLVLESQPMMIGCR